MIKAFQAVSIYGTGDASVLAKGISEALFTTAGGLFVAIPALIFYNYFIEWRSISEGEDWYGTFMFCSNE